ncbi:hypothetical protein CDL15_Pgr006114 [Punica granatum]|uniref:Uncharacterized protein n=1 Tax=Punica granatum TaxID=22663 RepID=A0A218VVC5_PUNGR|nr:hypothetical protein CDL15_Pgr006114 [Punica granatum]PKI68059.1 hypothetical protein CRG98_011655 [Punica granatum]
MANSRLARFVMEAAPPQFVSVMRHRTTKMLDTISEEETRGEFTSSDHSKSLNRSSSFSQKNTSTLSSSAPSHSPSASRIAMTTVGSRYFYNEVPRCPFES